MIKKYLKLCISLSTLLSFNLSSHVFAIDASDEGLSDGKEEKRKISVVNYLAQMEQEFDALPDAAARQNFLSTPIKLGYWRNVDNDTLYLDCSHSIRTIRKLNLLALTVSAGDVPLAKKFLSVVENINDEIWWSEGTSQTYSIAYNALDPRFKTKGTSCQSRLKMIDLVAAHNVNFTVMSEKKGARSHPAISAGMLTGHSSMERIDGDYTEEELRQARALLYGADLTQPGSSYTPFGSDGTKEEHLYTKAHHYYTALQQDPALSQHLRPHATVLAAFEKLSATN